MPGDGDHGKKHSRVSPGSWRFTALAGLVRRIEIVGTFLLRVNMNLSDLTDQQGLAVEHLLDQSVVIALRSMCGWRLLSERKSTLSSLKFAMSAVRFGSFACLLFAMADRSYSEWPEGPGHAGRLVSRFQGSFWKPAALFDRPWPNSRHAKTPKTEPHSSRSAKSRFRSK